MRLRDAMKLKKTHQKLVGGCLLLGILLFMAAILSKGNSTSDIKKDILHWKKETLGLKKEEALLSQEQYVEYAGTSYADWYAFAIGRMGLDEGKEQYLEAVTKQVQERYQTEEKLDAKKATEWHRIGLTILALGGDPTCVGIQEDGAPINLVADGTYLRGHEVSLGKQGINGYIWALLLLDSNGYEVPEGAFDTRSSIITQMIHHQNEDGGFSMQGKKSEVDITAMVLQALAPYYTQESFAMDAITKEQMLELTTICQVVEEALHFLATEQGEQGDYASNEVYNAESTAQVLIALCSLGIDPLVEERFIKNGHTVMDGLSRYRRSDGGYTHSLETECSSDSMASEQALLAMIAYERLRNGQSRVYDCRPESLQ